MIPMAEVETTTVVLITTTGLSLAQVPADLPRTFRLYEPALRVEGQPARRSRLRIFVRKDDFSYVEQERS